MAFEFLNVDNKWSRIGVGGIMHRSTERSFWKSLSLNGRHHSIVQLLESHLGAEKMDGIAEATS